MDSRSRKVLHPTCRIFVLTLVASVSCVPTVKFKAYRNYLCFLTALLCFFSFLGPTLRNPNYDNILKHFLEPIVTSVPDTHTPVAANKAIRGQ